MTAKEAQRKSNVNVAYRYDDRGHMWLAGADIAVRRIPTDNGELLFSKLGTDDLKRYNDWQPTFDAGCTRRRG